ncbi:hypothetical protein DOM21_14995 [Bacteriovorax stolpii]|uniref:DEAD/DEAH box helicase n=1 Tax=Bacteriovorax stolpii TaxID=960 RepID=UPI00115AC6CB|nr:DEAD/DEAH box helicase family protein [Bacteriovorax stolpii]QDK42733.1 hypothetical protein DOM21_14995 [Bacteriovorax stolpii]
MSSLYSRLKEGYQKRVVDRNVQIIREVISEEKQIQGRQVTVSPTGSGKTFMMASVIEVGLQLQQEPSFVWLTHNKQILIQTENEIMESLGAYTTSVYNIEQGIQSFGGRVLLFNVQKGVSQKSLTWLKQWYGRQKELNRSVVFIVDEADEGMSGDNMKRLRDALSPIIEIGFTGSFKKKPDEYEYERVTYKEVIDAGMLIQNIEYQASDEVSRIEMMNRAIQQRNWLEKIADGLKLIDRYFVPKMLIQAPARECENVGIELKKMLNLSEEEFNKQVIVHTQNSRGLEEVEDINDVRYIIGDLMVERGWNCPEAYVLLSTKDSVSVAKGIQLLGRVIRLPKCLPFDERFSVFNSAYVYISGKHAIEESCRKFTGDGVIEIPPPREVIQVEKRKDIKIPRIITYVDDLDKDPEDRDLIPTTEAICEVLTSIKKECEKSKPSIIGGRLTLIEGAVSRSPVELVEAEWNLEQTKKMLIDSLCKHLPRNYANVVAVIFQIQLRANGGLSAISPHIKEMVEKIKESTAIRKIAETLDYVYLPYEWPPHKLVIAQPLPTLFKRSLYPKIHMNNEELEFAHFLDDFCEIHNFHWTRNETSDVKLFRGHYPDFIIFSDSSYVFVEFKGKHLLDTPDSIRKNTIGQMASAYYMVYLNENREGFVQKGWGGEKDSAFKEIDLLTALKFSKK